MADLGIKHTTQIRHWRFMFRKGKYRLAMEHRASGVYVLATPYFILTALRKI